MEKPILHQEHQEPLEGTPKLGAGPHEEPPVTRLFSSLSLIEERLGYAFQDKEILIQAFIHKSFLNESTIPNLTANERLEFLGDAVLSLYSSSLLFTQFPTLEEGQLSQHKARLVCQESCAQMMQQLELIDYLVVGKGEQAQFTKDRPSVASDLFEAIIGAIFVDGGWAMAELFLSTHFSTHFSLLSQNPAENSKAKLQEFLAKKGRSLPEYHLNEIAGPPHEQKFSVSVFVEGTELGSATGRTKREAERLAAAIALNSLAQPESV